MPSLGGVVTVLVILLFVAGSLYAYYNHEMNKKAYLSFSGTDPSMKLFLNDRSYALSEDKMTVVSHEFYEVKITKDGFNDYIQQIKLDSREHAHIAVQMEKAVPPFGDLTVETTPPGATVIVDDTRWAGKTPVTVRTLKNGQKYRVWLSLQNYKPLERIVEIVGGKEINLNQPLEPNFAVVRITSEPEGAEVFLDGVKRGMTPFRMEQIVPGEQHDIKLSLQGYQDEAVAWMPIPGETKEIELKLKVSNGIPAQNSPPIAR
jgi:hypothetical protein